MHSTNLSKKESGVLLELTKNARNTDQDMAKKLGLSRPGIAKIRKRLEEKGIILGYRPVIDQKKTGLAFHAVMIIDDIDYSAPEKVAEAKETVRKLDETIAFIESPLAQKWVLLSSHKNHAEIKDYTQKVFAETKGLKARARIIVSETNDIIKPYNPSSPVARILRENIENKDIKLGELKKVA